MLDIMNRFDTLRRETPIGTTFLWRDQAGKETHQMVCISECGRRYTIVVAHSITLVQAA